MDFKPHPGYEVFFDEPGRVLAQPPRPRPPELEVRDRTVPGPAGAPDVAVRVYRRRDLERGPVLLDFHPGGFTVGSLDMCDDRGIFFAMETPCVVVAVDYRLAPDNQYPSQLRDCEAVLNYVAENPAEFGADPGKIALLGTSAGGNLAAGLCLWLRDNGGPKVSLQILNYPVTAGDSTTPSALRIGDAISFTAASGLREVMAAYTGPTNGWPVPYYALPANAPDLSGLPPAMVVTCEYDTLRDEGIDYARRLMDAGVPCQLHSMPGVPHAWDEWPGALTDWARASMKLALQRAFGMLG